MPKQTSSTPSSRNIISLDAKSNKKEKCTSTHKLASYFGVDHVPIDMHSSPIPSMTLRKTKHKKALLKMERKLANTLLDGNSPCVGQSRKLQPVGEINSELFDSYMIAAVPNYLHTRVEEYSPGVDRYGQTVYDKHIIYTFDYPNFPSFQHDLWASNYVQRDQSVVAQSLANLGGSCFMGKGFAVAYYRCIAKKLIVSMNTTTNIYSLKLTHWVQKKVSRTGKWVDSF